jgi:hypothetical protein
MELLQVRGSSKPQAETADLDAVVVAWVVH